MIVNILYVIQFLGHGGTEKQLVQLIRGLEGSRFRPHLCTLMPSGGYYEELDIPKVHLQFRSFLHPSILSRVALFSAFVRKHQIHIVQTFFQDPFVLAAMMKPWHKYKLIGSFRDLGFWRSSGAIRKMRMAYPLFDAFIANSQAVKDHFVEVDRITPSRIKVIHNGVDVNGVRPRTVRLPLVGMVANCNRTVKRVQDFIQAAALVHRNQPETRFMIVGDGPLRPELEQLSRSLCLDGVMKFTGQLADPINVISSFSVGVISSESEGFCNAILEYMATGVAVVATATGGNRELVRNGENGFLVPVGDPQQMAEKIQLLLREDDLRERMYEVNRTKVAVDFSTSGMIGKHESCYERIL